MKSIISQYLTEIQAQLKTGHAQEHSYRPALEALFKGITQLQVVNEPKGSAHGRPDFIFLKGDIPIAWAEAKDLHINLEQIEKSEQMSRYFGYANLILTNGIEFRFFKNGKRYGEPMSIAVKKGDILECNENAYDPFIRLFTGFIENPAETIRSAAHLAKIMGGKAARLRDNVLDMLRPDFIGQKGDIESVMHVLKMKLIHDLTPEQFADLYAQTLVYGLFVARYNDDTSETFSRTEARDKIPASNHLLQQFFDHIAGANFVKKLAYIVDELCDVFVHSSVHDLVHGLYLQMNLKGETHDPIIHFYEDFLREYNPDLRMQRGVFYTPLPAVRYIVRSVDALLQEHFGLIEGLADRSKIEHEYKVQDQKKKGKEMINRVQILDPAVGTGTFLDQVIREIHAKFKGQEGMWPAFVNDHLIPRLNGFELMMASYTIAHLKLSMTLAETGIAEVRKRLRIFLTNSLEEAPEKDDTLFAPLGLDGALTEEGILAAEIKRDLPIMVVMGNPPYSVSSQNASVEIGADGKKRKTWIGALLDDYKKDLNEKKINLDDDYIKFIRFSHHLVEKNGKGIVAMITNNSFLDGITHRQMRKSLLETFDHIYVLDLHGSSKRKETAPDGGKDENVFDIQQGVSINIFVKTTSGKKGLGIVHHYDLYGKQESKYEWLDNHDVSTTDWKELEAPKPNFFFVPKDFGLGNEYNTLTKIIDLFPVNSNGLETHKDEIAIQDTEEKMSYVLDDFRNLNENEIRIKYNIQKEGRDWKMSYAKNGVSRNGIITEIDYRPFDKRYTYFSPYSKGLVAYPRYEVLQHLKYLNNFALLVKRQCKREFSYIFAISHICEACVFESAYAKTQVLPLYIYSSTLTSETRTANLNMELLNPLLKKLQCEWMPDGTGNGVNSCGPEDIFDYIYAVLHCPTYRERYKEFLKIDFPRVPFTGNPTLFWNLVTLGREIRSLHLLESPILHNRQTTYPINGSNTVEKVTFEGGESGKVCINSEQYFGGVPRIAWEFPIGGYQPAQKWLKDRKGRTLNSDDIAHYQKMIVALMETDRLMKEIDDLISKNGGFPLL